jgi:hypothetical protein
VPRALRIGVRERVLASGRIEEPLAGREVARASAAARGRRAGAVAVCFLHSWARPAHERQLGRALARAGLHVTLSHRLVREYREYERVSTAVVNAYVGPVMAAIPGLAPSAPRGLRVMQSSGGLIGARVARDEPVRTVLSGPAGGVVGAAARAGRAGLRRIITFDMGGTSADVSLVDGAPAWRTEARIGDLPIRVPAVDIHTVGAGGGSLARLDAGGALRVGPRAPARIPARRATAAARRRRSPTRTSCSGGWSRRSSSAAPCASRRARAERALAPLARRLGWSLASAAPDRARRERGHGACRPRHHGRAGARSPRLRAGGLRGRGAACTPPSWRARSASARLRAARSGPAVGVGRARGRGRPRLRAHAARGRAAGSRAPRRVPRARAERAPGTCASKVSWRPVLERTLDLRYAGQSYEPPCPSLPAGSRRSTAVTPRASGTRTRGVPSRW